MAKPLTSSLVPSFLQHNLHHVIWDVVCMFQWQIFKINLQVLQKVGSRNSWDKFQICCTDMYFIRFLSNFAVFFIFCEFTRIFLAPRPCEISKSLNRRANYRVNCGCRDVQTVLYAVNFLLKFGNIKLLITIIKINYIAMSCFHLFWLSS